MYVKHCKLTSYQKFELLNHYRRTPVGSPWAVSPLRSFCMGFEVSQDNLIGDIAAGGAEISTRPKPAAPIAFAQGRKFLLYLAR